MIRRIGGYLYPRNEKAPKESRQIEREGYGIIRKAFASNAIGALRNEILEIYETEAAGGRAQLNDDQFRYEMFNRSARAQKIAGRREILDVVEPLLGEDCHIIANTCWRNPATPEGSGGGEWHLDAGPHVPRRMAPDGPIKSPIQFLQSVAIFFFRIARWHVVRPA